MIRTINAVVRIDRQMPFTIAQVKQDDEVTLILRVTNDGNYLDLSNQSIILRTEINGKTHIQSNNTSHQCIDNQYATDLFFYHVKKLAVHSPTLIHL